MGKILLKTFIRAPLDRCFDLSRSVNLHVKSAVGTGERAIAGVTHGLMGADDVVTWEARHFGVAQKISTKITAYDRPRYFRDSQIQGIFSRFDHEHFFEPESDGTLMIDIFKFECPLGVLGWFADFFVRLHLKRFLMTRNLYIKKVAECEDWRSFI